MYLFKYEEKIDTECTLIGRPILNVRAIKLDDSTREKNLKTKVGCKHLKSCDYIKRKTNKLYFIEISDFHQQLEDLKINKNNDVAKKAIKNEVRLKLSDTLLIYEQIKKKIQLKKQYKLTKKSSFNSL